MAHNEPSQQVLRLKTTIVALIAFGVGLALLVTARAIDGIAGWEWLAFWPLGELGGILVGAGVLGIAWDYFDGRDREARDDERLRRLLKESAPDLRDAVVQGFALDREDLERVATPELLDDIAANALGMRLDDPRFARAIYADLVDNVIRAPERWYEVDVRVRLSSVDERDTAGVPRFAVTVTWEYSVELSSSVQRFACTSDREEFHELLSDVPSTSVWFMTPRPGFDAAERHAFELLQYSINGEELPIRRSARRHSQMYSVNVDKDRVRSGRLVRVRHVYRTITPQSGHMLHLTIAQPTQGLTLALDYTDTDIASMRVTDLISSAHRPRLSSLPEQTRAREITLDVPGWILPQAEVTYVWTLASEVRAENAATSAAREDANGAVLLPE